MLRAEGYKLLRHDGGALHKAEASPCFDFYPDEDNVAGFMGYEANFIMGWLLHVSSGCYGFFSRNREEHNINLSKLPSPEGKYECRDDSVATGSVS